MKRFLHIYLFSVVTLLSLTTQAADFQWGTAAWNIQDGKVYEDISDLKQEGIVLTFTNPANYSVSFFQLLAVNYDLFVDDQTEPIKAGASSEPGKGLVVEFDYDFVEGHRYKIVTTESRLMQANLATRQTDTLSTNTDSYTISFSIKGPELVKTIEVEGTMALTITNQEATPTYSELDTEAIKSALGISEMSEAKAYGLNLNGSYNRALTSPDFGYDVFDGWRDADGEYTVYAGGAGGGIYNLLGHNPYPAVYCIKITEALDAIYYYFYDYWKEYDPNAPDSGGGIISMAPRRAPDTHYHNMIWDWEWTDEEGNPQVTQYTRYWRCDEGEDYKASYAIIANKKMVRINATLHFVSQEEYEKLMGMNSVKLSGKGETAVYGIDGRRRQSLTRGLNVLRQADGTATKVLVK